MIVFKKTNGWPHDVRFVPDDYQLQPGEIRYQGDSDQLARVVDEVKDPGATNPSDPASQPPKPDRTEQLITVLKTKNVISDQDIPKPAAAAADVPAGP